MAWLEKFWFGCGHCHGIESCPAAQAAEQAGRQNPGGIRLVFSVIVVFILPLLTSITGAYLAGKWSSQDSGQSLAGWQAAGMLAGLAAGIGTAKLLLLKTQSENKNTGRST